jgi:hypothetical protein
MTKKTRLDMLLHASNRARALLAEELRMLIDSHTNPATGNVDADARPEISKFKRGLKRLDAALAAYGIKV